KHTPARDHGIVPMAWRANSPRRQDYHQHPDTTARQTRSWLCAAGARNLPVPNRGREPCRRQPSGGLGCRARLCPVSFSRRAPAKLGQPAVGGEQQMLAIARALSGAPKVLLLDEPMEGLAPIVVDALYNALVRIREQEKPTIVLVEQKADLALAFAEEA